MGADIKKITEKIIQNLIHHRWLVISMTTLVWLLAVISASGLKLDEDIMTLLPDNDPQIIKYRELLHQFNPMNAMIIDVSIDSTIDQRQDILIKTADSLYHRLYASQYFNDIIYHWDIRDLQQVQALLMKYRSLLLSAEDSIKIRHKLEYRHITDQFNAWKRLLAETPSPFIARQFRTDPLNFNEFLLAKINAAHSVHGNVKVLQGRLFTQNLDHILIITQPKFQSTDNKNSEQLVAFIDGLITEIEKESEKEIDISYLAAHRFSVENARRIKNDVRLTVTLALLAIIILSLLVYSRPILMLLTLLPALFGSAISLGLMRWIMPEISAIIIGSGAMLIGIAVDYGIHFLYHLDQIKRTEEHSKEIITLVHRLIIPLILAAGTTVLAFLTLQFSAMPGYRQLSLFVALGIVGALIFVLAVLPAVVRPGSADKRRPFWAIGNHFPGMFSGLSKHRPGIIGAVVLITLFLTPGVLRLSFDGDVQNLNAVSPEIQRDLNRIYQTYGNMLSSTLVMVNGSNTEEALQNNEKIYNKIEEMNQKGYFGSVGGVGGLLPSLKQQNRNHKRWQNLFDPNTIQKLAMDLEKNAQESGLKAGQFEEFLNGLLESPPHLTVDAYQGSLLEDIFANFIRIENSGTSVLINLKLNSLQSFEQVKEQLEDMMPEVVVYNGHYFVGRMIKLIFGQLRRVALIALILVFLFLFLIKRNWRDLLIFSIPLLISLFWTFGIMGWLGIKINIINSIISVFVFGLVIDYCIFLSASLEKNKTKSDENFLRTTGGAITISALTTMIGLGVLIFAKHPALYSLGITSFLGVGIGLITVLILIPAISYKKEE